MKGLRNLHLNTSYSVKNKLNKKQCINYLFKENKNEILILKLIILQQFVYSALITMCIVNSKYFFIFSKAETKKYVDNFVHYFNCNICREI